jgi:hypothetical protein
MAKKTVETDKVDIYTNEILSFEIDQDYIHNKFCFGKITHNSNDDKKLEENTEKKFIKIFNKLNAPKKVLSYLKYKENIYWMSHKLDDITTIIQDKQLLVYKYPTLETNLPDSLPDWILKTLLFKATIKIIAMDPKDRIITHAGNVYIIASGASFYTEYSKDIPKEILKALHIEYTKDWKLGTNNPYTEEILHEELADIIKVTTVTFTSIKYIEMLKEKKIIKKARFIDKTEFELNGDFAVPARITAKGEDKSEKGELNSGKFIKCVLGNKKNRIAASITDHHNTERDDLDKTRAGGIKLILKYLDQAYQGHVKITLKQYNFEKSYHQNKLGTDMEREYKDIKNILKGCNFRIIDRRLASKRSEEININRLINQTLDKLSDKHKRYDKDLEDLKPEDTEAIAELKSKIKTAEKKRQATGLTILTEKQSTTINKPEVTILVVNNPEDYDTEPDAYKIYKNENPNKIIQAITDNNLADIYKTKSIFQNLLANIIYKLEYKYGFFPEMNRPKLYNNAWFILPVRIDGTVDDNEDDEETEDIAEKLEQQEKNAKFAYYIAKIVGGVPIYSILSKKDKQKIKNAMGSNADLLVGRKKQTKKINTEDEYTTYRNPVLFFPETSAYVIFAQTSRFLLPDFQLHEDEINILKKNRSQPINIKYLAELILRDDLPAELITIVKNLHDKYYSNSDVTYDELLSFLKKNKVSKSIKQKLLDTIEIDLKNRYRDKAKSKKHPEYFAHQYGFPFSYKNKIYAAGMVHGAKYGKQSNFCILYQMITNMDELPENLDKLFLSFSIRNKQTTVYPFIFKHIREYALNDLFKSTDKDYQNSQENITTEKEITVDEENNYENKLHLLEQEI